MSIEMAALACARREAACRDREGGRPIKRGSSCAFTGGGRAGDGLAAQTRSSKAMALATRSNQVSWAVGTPSVEEEEEEEEA
jgi:hypothetical protein